MARKVFVSFLGHTNYGKCFYVKDDYKSNEVRYVQEAILDYLVKKEKWDENSVAYILLTEGAEKTNWVDNGQKDKEKNTIMQTGLKSQLDGLSLPFKVEPIKNLPDGNTTDEIWEIFERVFQLIQDGDELYFDLTHGFRYLPMLSLVLGNYAKFLKKVTVGHISYGNFEGRDKKTNEALLVDLMPLVSLQDWTFAAGQYLETGNVASMYKLSDDELKPILKASKGQNEDARQLKYFVASLRSVVEERTNCRGISIIKSDSIRSLKDKGEKLENVIIRPLNPIIEKVKSSIEDYDDNENDRNGYLAARWCFGNGLYQQATTILLELVVTFFCRRHGISIDDEKTREVVNQAFNLKFYHKESDEGDNWAKVANKEKVREILADELFERKDLVGYFHNLTEVRNDFNHSGMRSEKLPLTPKSIRENLEKCLNGFASLFENTQEDLLC